MVATVRLRNDQDLERRIQHYLDLRRSGIYPDPRTMGYRDENDRKRDMLALQTAKRRVEAKGEKW